MAKKGIAGHSKRIDPAELGVDMDAVFADIKPHLEHMTNAEIGEKANLSPLVVSQTWNNSKPMTLGKLAAFAKAAGGSLELRFKPPKKS